MSESNQNVSNIVRKIAETENVQDYSIVQIYSGKRGEGYLGVIKAMQLVGSNKSVNILIKISKGLSEFIPIHDFFSNEILCYEHIFPAFVEFQNDLNIPKPFNNIVQCLGFSKELTEEWIVMDNVKADNFEMWNSMQLMDDVHFELVITTLAKFHGTSFALKTFQPERYHKFAENIFPEEMFDSIMVKMHVDTQWHNLLKNTLHIFDELTEDRYRKKLIDLFKIVADEYKRLFKYASKVGTVIAHGDCWCNNLMFKYKDLNNRSTPIDMKLLDFQLAMAGTPAVDLSTFFFGSASPEALRNEQYYLKLYYDALEQHVKQFNLDVATFYSFDDLLEDWKIMSKLGLIVSFLYKKLMLIKSEDAGEFDDPNYTNNMVLSEENSKLYDQQMKVLIIHCVDHKYI